MIRILLRAEMRDHRSNGFCDQLRLRLREVTLMQQGSTQQNGYLHTIQIIDIGQGRQFMSFLVRLFQYDRRKLIWQKPRISIYILEGIIDFDFSTMVKNQDIARLRTLDRKSVV